MTAPPKRRWFRFGLRTMFVLIAVAAVACVSLPVGWSKYQAWRQKQALMELDDRMQNSRLRPSIPAQDAP